MKGVIILILFSLFVAVAYAQSPTKVVEAMINGASKLEGFTAEITKEERVNGELIKQVTNVKLKRIPYQLYLNQQFPKKGVEVLCLPFENKALVNPNSFPWINLSLDPYGSLMRKNQHHTVYDSGFDLMSNILMRELERIGKDTSRHIFYRGLVDWQRRPAHYIEMSNPDYTYYDYMVQMGEDVISIAKKLNVSEYAILELNEDISFYDDVSPGQTIVVPSSYAKKMVLYIDKEYMLPLVIMVYDASGLYESYSYKNFVLNPVFAANEFSSEFGNYGF